MATKKNTDENSIGPEDSKLSEAQEAARKHYTDTVDGLTGWDIKAIEKEALDGKHIDDDGVATSPDFWYGMAWRYKLKKPETMSMTWEQALSLTYGEVKKFLGFVDQEDSDSGEQQKES